MTNKELETALADALGHAVPDVLDQVLQACAEPKGAPIPMKSLEQSALPRRKRRAPWILVASLALAFCGMVAGWQLHASTVTVARVALDVNPSVEFSLDRNDRVLDVTACNADAEQLLAGLELNKKQLDEAVDSLMGAFAANGYLQQKNGAVLITVDAKNGKETELEEKLSNQVKRSMSAHALSGNVLSQKVTSDQELQRKAQEWDTSFGRAALYQRVAQALGVDPAQLQTMTVQQLQTLLHQRGISMEDAGLDPMFSQFPLDEDAYDALEDILGLDNDWDDVNDPDDWNDPDDPDDWDDMNDPNDDLDDPDDPDDWDDVNDPDDWDDHDDPDDHDDWDDHDDDHDDFDDHDDDIDD